MKTNPIFQGILDEAHLAGREAGEKHRPTPMGFYASDLQGRRLSETEVVADGVCGFAWVHIKGNTAFGRWAKQQGHARKNYYGGLDISIRGYGQSMEKKEAHARAAAEVLKRHGIEAYAQSRMD